ncbi:MAG: hypothetical protein ACREGF_05255, partial [Candidatus Saccharimonadales bacterium]
RYMPDPDIPPVVLSQARINQVKAEMPVMPAAWRTRFDKLGLDKSQTESLLDIHADSPERGYLAFIDQQLGQPDFAKFVANVIMNVYQPFRAGDSGGSRTINPQWPVILQQIYNLVKAGQLSSTKYKQLILDLNDQPLPTEGIEQYAVQNNYIQVSDQAAIAKIVDQVLAENPKAAADLKNGETKVAQFLVGQVMKASRGKANPGLAFELINKQLGRNA